MGGSNAARRGILAVAWVVTAVLAGFLANRWGTDLGSEIRRRAEDSPRPVEEPADGPTLQGKGSARAQPDAGEAPAAEPSRVRVPTAAKTASETAASADPFDVRLDVHVLTFDGEDVVGALVYAVPAGASWGGDGPAPWPRARTGDDGHAHLALPAPGRYDVGALRSFANAMARDVIVPRGPPAEMELVLPDMADLVVTVEANAGDAAMGGTLVVERVDDEDLPIRDLPGRDERAGVTMRRKWTPPETTLHLPRGMPVTILLEGRGVLLQQHERSVAAPALVVLKRPEPRTLQVRPRFRLPPGREPLPVYVGFQYGARALLGAWGSLTLADARNGGTPAVVLRGHGREGRLRWSGRGIVASSVEVPAVAPGREDVVDVVIEVVPASAVPALEGVDVDGAPPDVSVEQAEIWTWRRSGAEILDLEGAPLDQPTPVTSEDGGKRALVIWGPWWASDPFTLPMTGRARVEVRPAGWLLAVMERPPPASLGRLDAVRADGSPVGVARSEHLSGEDTLDYGAPLVPGCLLGPLPEGPVELVVRAAGVEVARLHATVRAGRLTPVTFPW